MSDDESQHLEIFKKILQVFEADRDFLKQDVDGIQEGLNVLREEILGIDDEALKAIFLQKIDDLIKKLVHCYREMDQI